LVRVPIDAEALNRIDWNGLKHAHGRAGGLPDLLRALWSADRRERRSAYESLEEDLHHQLTRYQASAPAVPFIIDVVADESALDRHLALRLLSDLAVGDESAWLTDGSTVEQLRREVDRKAGMTVEELENDLAEWVAAEPDEASRRAREETAEFLDVVEFRDAERWELAAYNAVRAGVAVFAEALKSADPLVRTGAAHVLGWFAEERSVIMPHLVRLLTTESDTSVAATASIAAGLLGGDDPALLAALESRLDSRDPAQRWAAAIALARLSPSPGPRAVHELHDCVRNGDRTPAVPYENGDMSVLAALSLAYVADNVAPDRIDVLLERLSRMPLGPEAIPIGQTIIKIAFPDGPLPEGTTFADLSGDQRRLAVVLHAADNSDTTLWWRPSDHFNLPRDIDPPA
jgi:hypothetical protein